MDGRGVVDRGSIFRDRVHLRLRDGDRSCPPGCAANRRHRRVAARSSDLDHGQLAYRQPAAAPSRFPIRTMRRNGTPRFSADNRERGNTGEHSAWAKRNRVGKDRGDPTRIYRIHGTACFCRDTLPSGEVWATFKKSGPSIAVTKTIDRPRSQWPLHIRQYEQAHRSSLYPVRGPTSRSHSVVLHTR